MRVHQLFSLIPDTDLYHHYDFIGNRVVTRNRVNLPFVKYPNGKPCLLVNAFLLDVLKKKNLSTKNRGGTLRAYAKDLSHLIRYCFYNDMDFYEMNDSHFRLFMNNIQAERQQNNPQAKKRESNTSVTIGRKTLSFLDYVGKYHSDADYVEKIIKATKKSFKQKSSKREQYFDIEFWHHESFETDSSIKKRSPIRKAVIDSLYSAVSNIRSNNHSLAECKFLDSRNTCLIRVLEMTGARIEEVSEIKVYDIEKALTQKHPKLELMTVKQGDDLVASRLLPVLLQDLAVLKKYIRIYRSKIIKNTVGKTNDDGYLFVSLTKGKKMSSESLSNLIGKLRRESGIDEQACAHMFRHRFITKLFIKLLIQFDFENKDDFRRYILDTNSLKVEIQEYTGHKSLGSLDIYIDEAFNEVSHINAIVSTVNLQKAYESFDENILLLQNELRNGLPVEKYLERYDQLIELRLVDIARLEKIDKNMGEHYNEAIS